MSAIEFAFFVPILGLGLLAMVDIGLSVGTRMELDRNVRSGAQAAMSLNNDASAIEEIVFASAGRPPGLAVEVAMSCFCGAAPAGCSALCATSELPSVFYDIRAARRQAGFILGERTIASATRVQIR